MPRRTHGDRDPPHPGSRPAHRADPWPALSRLRRRPSRSGCRTSVRAVSGRSRSTTTTRSSGRPSPARRSPAAHPGSGATPSCCRSTQPPTRGLPVGSTPLLAADRLAPALGLDQLWIKDDTRNPSLSFKDRAVAVAAARARRLRGRGPGLRLDRQPGRRHRRRGRRPGAAGVRVHPGRPRAGQDRSRAGVRRDGRPDRRAPTTTSTGSVSRSPTRPAGGSSTSTCGRSTPRAPRRSRTRSPSRSAGARRT